MEDDDVGPFYKCVSKKQLKKSWGLVRQAKSYASPVPETVH